MFDFLTTRHILQSVSRAETRNSQILHMTANENIMSPLSEYLLSSELSTRYDFGLGENGVISGKSNADFSAITIPAIHGFIQKAEFEMCRMLHAQKVYLNCLSGIHAMTCALLTMTKPGDMVMSINEHDGGHFCTRQVLLLSGRKHSYVSLDKKSKSIDVAKTAWYYKKKHASAIYLDPSVFLSPLPIKDLRKAVGEKAIICFDASHVLGLIMGGEFQSPLLEGANIISSNTHKTFPGPHHGILAFRDSDAGLKSVEKISNSLVSTVHTNSLMSLCATILEFKKFGKNYAKQIIQNSNTLGEHLEKKGFNIRYITPKVYSQNHQIHMLVRQDNKKIITLFLDNSISVNTSSALGDGLIIRFGTQELTKKGMKETEMKLISEYIRRIFDGQNVSKEVQDFNRSFQAVKYCFSFNNASMSMP